MSAPFWTLDRIAEALDGRSLGVRALGEVPHGAQPIAGISTDTRAIREGDCFVALVGERFDAHDFLRDAVAKGARALIVSRAESAAGLGVSVYEVGDTQAALGALANYRRHAWGKAIVGIGGSNGKTTTKELVRAALGSVLHVHATHANLNNLIGVPLTLLALPDEAEVAVVEMGMNIPGEMAQLRAIVEPDIALLTCVAEEHLEGLGSMDTVMREETLIYDGASVAIAPAVQPEIADIAVHKAGRVVTAGLDAGDVRADRWGMEGEGQGWIELCGVTVRPPVRGAHNLRNTMLALAVARECGVSMADAARGIAAMPLPSMRTSWESLGGATLINDAYNASPASMRAALDLLESLGAGRQRVAVLGTMRELGVHAERLHAEIARRALESSIEVLAGVGEMGAALGATSAGDPRVLVATDVEDLWPALEPRLAPNAIVLLKASRAVKLERLVPSLTAWANR
ncbi:MAG TPA: UDP-N-acetylmuramoyl-tripeptide--D-alanyl-D-alanine ligase [Gemmatimonadaceae bacterium]